MNKSRDFDLSNSAYTRLKRIESEGPKRAGGREGSEARTGQLEDKREKEKEREANKQTIQGEIKETETKRNHQHKHRVKKPRAQNKE